MRGEGYLRSFSYSKADLVPRNKIDYSAAKSSSGRLANRIFRLNAGNVLRPLSKKDAAPGSRKATRQLPESMVALFEKALFKSFGHTNLWRTLNFILAELVWQIRRGTV